MLLTEHIPFIVNRKLIEESISKNQPLVVTGVIQRAEAKNQNGRIYPKEILEREIQNYNTYKAVKRASSNEYDDSDDDICQLLEISTFLITLK